MKKLLIKSIIAVLAIMSVMLVLANSVNATENQSTDITNWGYNLIKTGKNDYKILFSNTNFKEGHSYYLWVEKNDNVTNANTYLNEQLANGDIPAVVVNSVKITLIREDGLSTDSISDSEGNYISSLNEIVTNYSFFILETYNIDGTSYAVNHGSQPFKASLNSQNNWSNISNMKYDIARRLGKSAIESQNYWKDEYYDMILSNVTLNPDSDYFIWIDKNDGEFFNKDELFSVTAALINDSRLTYIENKKSADKYIATNVDLGVEYPKNIEDLVKNYSFQIIEERKVPGTNFEAAKVVFDKTAIKASTSYQNWTDTSKVEYTVKKLDESGYGLELSNIELKAGHDYYIWMCKNGEGAQYIPEDVNLDFYILDYAYLFELDKDTKTVSVIRNNAGQVETDLANIYGNYNFQIIESYMPEGGNVAISRVVLNKTLIEEPKEEESKEEDKEDLKNPNVQQPTENPEQETTQEYTYKVVSGENQTYKNEDLTVKFDAPVEELVKVSINGNKLDAEYYTATEGSTVLTVSKTYLKTLQSGTYNLVAKYESGKTAETTFVVENEQDGTEADEVLPQTGLFTTVSCAALVALVGMVYVFYNRYKRIVIK